MTAITGWEIKRWPFDMVKFLNYYTMIMHDSGSNLDMYEAYCGTDNAWVATKVIENIITGNLAIEQVTFGGDTVTLTGGPTTFGSTVRFSRDNSVPLNWDFADFDWFYGMSFAYLNENTITSKCYQRSPGVASSTAAVTAIPTAACPAFIACCNYNGQPILGGIISTDPTWTQLGLASVCWGAIGQWEFRPSVNRTAGFIRMPWSDWDKGLVLKIIPLAKRLIVYGNGGSTVLLPYEKEGVVGFGLDDKTIGPGISSGFHVCGSKDKHLFVGNDYNIYLTNETGDFGKVVGFKKLGYKEYVKEMIDENNDIAKGTPLCLSYDSSRRRYYISGVHSSYCLTEFGFYKCHQSTTGVGRFKGDKLTGFVKDNNDHEARMTSETIDLRIRGMKTVETLEFGLDCGSDAYGAIDFKYNYDTNSIYRNSSWKPISPNGVVYPGVTATDFRIKFKSLDYRDGIKLDAIDCKWKMSDRRSVRGMTNVNKAQSRQAE
jgi:hypothetical protein